MADLNERIVDIIAALEREGCLGERFKGPTGQEEVRFGTHGSLSVIVRGPSQGSWYDHELQEGGGPWDLIRQRGGHTDVAGWLREHHLADDPGGGPRRARAERDWGDDRRFDDQPDYEPDYEPAPRASSSSSSRQPLAVYDYVDEDGTLLFQVVRFPDHVFRQRRPDGKGGWEWRLGTTPRVLYRLPELIAARKTGNGHPWRVYLCEGEKDADRLRADWGVTATTNPGGAKNWQDKFDFCFTGAEVILLEDNDAAGRDRTQKLAPRLAKVAMVVKVIRLFHTTKINDKGEEVGDGKDISNWLDEGGSQSTLEDLIEDTEPYQLPPEAQPEPPEPIWSTNKLSDWAGRVIPEREWIMPDWIPFGQTTGLYGVSGVRKTTWLLQLMMAASAGLHFCGRLITKTPVFGLFCEDTINEIVLRASRIATFYGRTLADFPDFHFASLVGVMNTELMVWDHEGRQNGPAYDYFEHQLQAHRPGLVSLDTLPDFFGGNEVDRRQTSNFVRLLDSFSIKYGCAMLCTAHPSLRGRTSGRLDSGNTGIEGKMRARLSLHDPGNDDDMTDEETPEEKAHRIALHPSDKRILTRQNSNYAKPGETIELTIRDGAFTADALDTSNQHGPMRHLEVRAKFKEILRIIIDEGGHVNDSRQAGNRIFAPTRFRTHARNRQTRFTTKEFAQAMDALLEAKEIKFTRRDNRRELVFV